MINCIVWDLYLFIEKDRLNKAFALSLFDKDMDTLQFRFRMLKRSSTAEAFEGVILGKFDRSLFKIGYASVSVAY